MNNLLCAVIFVVACKEQGPLEVALPDHTSKQYYISDTTTVRATTVRENALTADEKFYCLAGSYTDPLFGYARASFCAQFRLSSAGVIFDSLFIPDSVVFYLPVKGYYGNEPGSHTFRIFELNDPIYADSAYYSSSVFSYNPAEIASVTGQMSSTDFTLRVPANNSFLQKFYGSGGFTDDDSFLSFFKGIYFATDSATSSSIVYFNLQPGYGKLTLYYNGSSSYDFVISTSSARINLFYHDYTGSTVQAALADTAPVQSLVYIQSMAGVKSKIILPYINDWKNRVNPVLAKAELAVPVAANSGYATYSPPAKLFLAGINDDGSVRLLEDELEGEAYFGGQYNASSNSYTFSITRYLQKKMDGTISDHGLFLYVANSSEAGGSAANGSRGVMDAKGIKLTLLYTYR